MKSEAELSFDGQRISITFRTVATWMTPEPSLRTLSATSESMIKNTYIWGQGATRKTRKTASDVDSDIPVSVDVMPSSLVEKEAASIQQLLIAFSAENRLATFDWDTYYGSGFDVIDMKSGTM